MVGVKEKILSNKEIITQVEGAGTSQRVSPLAPDFILILFFAIFVDSIDILLLVLKIFTAFTIGQGVSMAMDVTIFVIIGGWIFWRVGRISKSKRARQQALAKTIKKKQADLTKQLAKGIKSPAKKMFTRGGIALLGEFIPLIGLVPFWTIAVVLTLREK